MSDAPSGQFALFDLCGAGLSLETYRNVTLFQKEGEKNMDWMYIKKADAKTPRYDVTPSVWSAAGTVFGSELFFFAPWDAQSKTARQAEGFQNMVQVECYRQEQVRLNNQPLALFVLHRTKTSLFVCVFFLWGPYRFNVT